MNNDIFTSFHYLVGNDFVYKNKVEVKVFFIYNYQNVVKTFDIKKKKDANESYYINEAKSLINGMIKNGSLIKQADEYIKKNKRKKRLFFSGVSLLCASIIAAAAVTTYFLVKASNAFNPSKWPTASREEVTAVINNLFDDYTSEDKKINQKHLVDSLEKINCQKGKLSFYYSGTAYGLSNSETNVSNIVETFNFADDVYLKRYELSQYGEEGEEEIARETNNYAIYLDDNTHRGINEFKQDIKNGEKAPSYLKTTYECASLKEARDFVNEEIDEFDFDDKSYFFIGSENAITIYSLLMEDPKNVNLECHMKNENSVYIKNNFVSDIYGTVHLELCFDETLLRVCHIEYNIPNLVQVLIKQTITPSNDVINEYDPSWFTN